jgi:hypothetical protein
MVLIFRELELALRHKNCQLGMIFNPSMMSNNSQVNLKKAGIRFHLGGRIELGLTQGEIHLHGNEDVERMVGRVQDNVIVVHLEANFSHVALQKPNVCYPL